VDEKHVGNIHLIEKVDNKTIKDKSEAVVLFPLIKKKRNKCKRIYCQSKLLFNWGRCFKRIREFV
jgi:hypothetical protein